MFDTVIFVFLIIIVEECNTENVTRYTINIQLEILFLIPGANYSRCIFENCLTLSFIVFLIIFVEECNTENVAKYTINIQLEILFPIPSSNYSRCIFENCLTLLFLYF